MYHIGPLDGIFYGSIISGMEDNLDKKRYTEEEKRNNFKRLAEKRTQLVLDRMRVLGNLGNKKLYSYNESDLNKIFFAIDEARKELEIRFKGKDRKPFEL